ncbi:MAG: putative cytokinetic ring protein SteA [bacterium]
MDSIRGTVRTDRRTKRLVKRLNPGDIALIDHEDLDVVAAENLIAAGAAAVLNCCASHTGKYVNRGPHALLDAGIPLLDNLGAELMNRVPEGATLELRGNAVYSNGRLLASGQLQTRETLDDRNRVARENLENQIEQFAENTLRYLKKEKSLLHGDLKAKHIPLDFTGRQVLVVVRGPDFRKDLDSLRSYIRERRPVIVGVDGGADALIAAGYKPDVILGDMDSVSDDALKCGATLIVHAYTSGDAPGAERLKRLGVPCHVLSSIGTSEDLALLLAHELGADIIVLVGSHFSMDEFLSKGRGGMASTFLTRLRVGAVIVDAKGVSKLYEARVRPVLLLYLIIAAAVPIFAVIAVSPLAGQFVRLLKLLLNL